MSGEVKVSHKMPTPPAPVDTYDSGDERQVREKRRKQATEQDQRKADLRTLMSMPEGRRTLIWLLGLTGPYRTSFATNALQMAHLEGVRSVGLQLTDALAGVDPEGWVRMQLDIMQPKENRHD